MIDFMRLKWLYFALSGLVIIPGLISLVLFGLKPSIDFTGGTELEIRMTADASKVAVAELQKTLEETVEVTEIRALPENRVVIKTKPIDAAKKDEALVAITKAYGKVEELRFETVGPVLGKELMMKTLAAILLSAGGITLYVAYRFHEWRYGACAVLAMFHDLFVLLGVFSLLGRFAGVEIDTLFVTAVLTILSFSVHDTIVVYDRIRELRRTHKEFAYVDIVNKAVTETLSRSLNNSLTIIFMLLALWLLGGDTIRWFVFALLIGTVTGTYSSTFTAAPLLVVWSDIMRIRQRK